MIINMHKIENSLKHLLPNYVGKEQNKPTIFNKKSKIVREKPLTYIESDTGKTRHFTPAAQE
jgi:hypothetical protein